MSSTRDRLVLFVTLLALLVPPGPITLPQVAWASDARARAETWVVTTTDDENGECTPEYCSLRQALDAAIENPGPDTITFDLSTGDPGYDAESGKWTISLGSPLPDLSDPDSLTVDATPVGPGQCPNGYLVIDASSVPYGVEITGANKVLKGVVIKNASIHGLYIHGTAAQNNQLMCSYVVSSTVDGVHIGGGAISNTIGGTGTGHGNVIAFNSADGVHVTNQASQNVVTGNKIGTNESGLAAWANGGCGVRLSNGAISNTVGLTGTLGGNLISGNGEAGVLVSGDTSQGNVVQNNNVGTDQYGAFSIANKDGVVVSDGARNTIGPENLISGNERDGVRIQGGTARENAVVGNYIGTNDDGDAKVTNKRLGIMLQGEAHRNTIGTAESGNLISGNGYDGDFAVAGGVAILGSNQNVLCNNLIGVMENGFEPLPNGGHGVQLGSYAQENVIGLGTAADCANTIAFNEGDGVHVEGEGTERDAINRNSIHDNKDLGIDNVSGGNIELAPPLITRYEATPSGLAELEATACPGCTIFVYSDDDGEGHEYEGSGVADASSGDFAWSGTPTFKAFTLVARDAYSNTSEFSAAPARLTLSIDDALPGVPVNKVAGDATAPANRTRIEVVAEVVSWDPSLTEDVDVSVTVPGDLFGSPTRVFVRDQIASSDGTATTYSGLGGGLYTADNIDLLPMGNIFRRRVVFRFELPNNTSPQQVYVQGKIDVPGRTIRDPQSTATVRVIKPGNLRTIIVANRHLLYDNYDDEEVTGLLERLFTEAQGAPGSTSPLATVYYVDAYSTTVRNWNNASVNFTSEATANTVANGIDALIEDWHEDATSELCFTINGSTFCLPISWPTYLLIAGDDDTIPFYRYDDPSNDEGVNQLGWCPQGWCVNSNANPAVRATDEDFFFTDNPYANVWGGADWQKGDVELWTGRILGETAADMLSLLEEGVNPNNGKRGGAVMASVDGWELGLEPGGSGGYADLHDVPALLRGKGFQVRNDDMPSSEVRTIDVMSPFEGGNASWNTNFRNAANNAGGMDLFFIGGHDNYDHAVIPGDDFSPDDTCAAATCDYNRFDDDHPIAMIVGCHGGLPVPDIDVVGGADDDMVYDLIHEGASAYIGATGFSYGSPNNLHKCTWGERLMQGFFGQLLKPAGKNSMTVGRALAEAKRDYVFGYGRKDHLDRKTVTEFNLYGVPWTYVYYPGAGATSSATTAESRVQAEPRAFAASGREVEAAAQADAYSRNFAVDFAGYSAPTETEGGVTYDLLSIEGGDLAIADGAPILPYVEAFALALPFSGTVTGVQVVGAVSSTIGIYNVPSAHVRPWSQGGMQYTTTTDVAGLYPANLVEWQETGAGVLFTLFPIQHDPNSGETVFYSHIEVQVTYEAPLPIGVSAFATSRASYAPGEAVNAKATVGNVGDTTATLSGTLTIENALGQVVESAEVEAFAVSPGESHELSLAWAGASERGSYRATLTIWQEGSVVGGAAAGFEVQVADDPGDPQDQHTLFLPLVVRGH